MKKLIISTVLIAISCMNTTTFGQDFTKEKSGPENVMQFLEGFKKRDSRFYFVSSYDEIIKLKRLIDQQPSILHDKIIKEQEEKIKVDFAYRRINHGFLFGLVTPNAKFKIIESKNITREGYSLTQHFVEIEYKTAKDAPIVCIKKNVSSMNPLARDEYGLLKKTYLTIYTTNFKGGKNLIADVQDMVFGCPTGPFAESRKNDIFETFTEQIPKIRRIQIKSDVSFNKLSLLFSVIMFPNSEYSGKIYGDNGKEKIEIAFNTDKYFQIPSNFSTVSNKIKFTIVIYDNQRNNINTAMIEYEPQKEGKWNTGYVNWIYEGDLERSSGWDDKVMEINYSFISPKEVNIQKGAKENKYLGTSSDSKEKDKSTKTETSAVKTLDSPSVTSSNKEDISSNWKAIWNFQGQNRLIIFSFKTLDKNIEGESSETYSFREGQKVVHGKVTGEISGNQIHMLKTLYDHPKGIGVPIEFFGQIDMEQGKANGTYKLNKETGVWNMERLATGQSVMEPSTQTKSQPKGKTSEGVKGLFKKILTK